MQFSNNLLRLGTESAFEVLARAQSMVSKGRDIINLGIGQPDFKTADHIVEAGVQALRDGHHGYTSANGILPLREAVSEDFLNRHNVEISPENIIIMPGGKPTMFFSILMFGAKNSEIMYPNPGFPIYESVINYSGSKAIPITLDISNNFKIDFDQLESSITENTSLIIINFPSNPTGGVISKEEWGKWGEKKSNLRVFGNISIPGIDITSGSLGHCIGAGAGMAVSYKANQQDKKVYVVISEGELYEGSTWEALLFAKHRELNNLTIIIDINSLIILGNTSDINFKVKNFVKKKIRL